MHCAVPVFKLPISSRVKKFELKSKNSVKWVITFSGRLYSSQPMKKIPDETVKKVLAPKQRNRALVERKSKNFLINPYFFLILHFQYAKIDSVTCNRKKQSYPMRKIIKNPASR